MIDQITMLDSVTVATPKILGDSISDLALKVAWRVQKLTRRQVGKKLLKACGIFFVIHIHSGSCLYMHVQHSEARCGVESLGKSRGESSAQKVLKHLHLPLPSLPALTCHGGFLEKGGGGP